MASWEYEGLFDSIMASDNQDDDLLSSFWRTEPSAIRVGSMGYRTMTIKAGTRLEADIYPVFGREKEKRLRAEKRHQTSERVFRNNINRAKRRLILLMEENFQVKKDIHLTLTYSGATPTYQQALRDKYNFMRRVKRLREKRGLPELKCLGSIGHDENQRIHIHMAMSGGISRDELEEIWGKGYANSMRIQDFGGGLSGLANYLYKQNEKEKLRGNRINMKSWFSTRNLDEPKVHSSDSKISKSRIKRIAYDFRNEAKDIMERIYPGYHYETCAVFYSDVVDGVYIRCVMRKNNKGGPVC